MRDTAIRRPLSVLRSIQAFVVLGAIAAALGISAAAAAPTAHARAAKFPISQFTCYPGQFSAFKVRQVKIQNQFDKLSGAVVVAPLRMCAPTIKNHEPIPDKSSHLDCFSLRVINGPTGTKNTIVTDQFGRHRLIVLLSSPESICLPASKSRRGTPGPVPTKLDHFVCYHVKPQDTFKQQTVTLQDQFGLNKALVLRIETLCAPTRKNGGPVVDPAVHLLCYDIETAAKGPGVQVRTQFGLMKASLGRATLLCEPASKRIVQ